MNSPSQRGRSLSSNPCSSSAREALTSRSGELSRAMAMLRRSVAGVGRRGKIPATGLLDIDLRPREDEILGSPYGNGEVRVQIGGQHGGDLRFVGMNMHADSLALQRPEPLPRTVLVGEGAREIS